VTGTPAAASDRVLGWDALRGFCALLVAFYHLAHWLELVELSAFATYGVYMFFVLSGASLAYTYPTQRFATADGVWRFLGTRWLRLAPLFLLVCIVFLAMLAARTGGGFEGLAWRLLLNATFAFGLVDPAITSIAVGGWSLGIEFVFYLLFPAFAAAVARPAWRWPLLLALAALQAAWIWGTVGQVGGWGDRAVQYHQVPAFGAYFFGGCVIGHLRREAGPDWPGSALVTACIGMLLLLVLATPLQPGAELLGLRGVTLFLACFGVVYVCGQARLAGRTAAWARHLGDATFGTYLLHPLLFFGTAWFIAPQWTQGTTGTRWLVLAVLVALAWAAGWASERWFEAPLRRRGQRWLRGGDRPPPPAPQSEVASISS
jgi:peptidoglycan/LPS O-acetylase OafA/YrhL